MLTYLALNDWSDILEEETLPVRERLAIAFQFLDDKAVTAYLRRCVDSAIARGYVDGIIVSGLASKSGLDILQSYVDRTGDVQSAAILGSYVCLPGAKGRQRKLEWGTERIRRVERWVESYRDLLDGFKMFHCRVGFDIERGQVVLSESLGSGVASAVNDDNKVTWVPSQILIRCNYCNKPIGEGVETTAEAAAQQKNRVHPENQNFFVVT